jgi:hypothetical protein
MIIINTIGTEESKEEEDDYLLYDVTGYIPQGCVLVGEII